MAPTINSEQVPPSWVPQMVGVVLSMVGVAPKMVGVEFSTVGVLPSMVGVTLYLVSAPALRSSKLGRMVRNVGIVVSH